jgi:hypothetical protein
MSTFKEPVSFMWKNTHRSTCWQTWGQFFLSLLMLSKMSTLCGCWRTDLQGGWLMNGANGNGNGKEGRRFVRLLRWWEQLHWSLCVLPSLLCIWLLNMWRRHPASEVWSVCLPSQEEDGAFELGFRGRWLWSGWGHSYLKGCKFSGEQGNLSVFFFTFSFQGVERKLLEKIMMEETCGHCSQILS